MGHSCMQAAPNGLNLLGTGNQSPVGGALNQLYAGLQCGRLLPSADSVPYIYSLGGIPLPIFSGGSEDCLFLDVWYVQSLVWSLIILLIRFAVRNDIYVKLEAFFTHCLLTNKRRPW